MAKGHMRVDASAVRSIVAPEYTDTWHPISHAHVLDAVDGVLVNAGIDAVERRYDLSANGNNLFATYTLNVAVNGRRWLLGFRNSLEKRFAVGFACGLHVCVCSNMVFTGEIVDFRKHTSGLDFAELLLLAKRAFGVVAERFGILKTWQDSLHEQPLPTVHRKLLTYNLLASGAVPPSRFHDLNACYDMEREISTNGETVYTLHGAATRLMNADSLFQVQRKNAALERVINLYMKAMAVQDGRA